jgi:hypothetical protein
MELYNQAKEWEVIFASVLKLSVYRLGYNADIVTVQFSRDVSYCICAGKPIQFQMFLP